MDRAPPHVSTGFRCGLSSSCVTMLKEVLFLIHGSATNVERISIEIMMFQYSKRVDSNQCAFIHQIQCAGRARGHAGGRR